MVGEVIFRKDQILAELIGGLLHDSKEFAPSSQPKTPTTEGFLGLSFSGSDRRFTERVLDKRFSVTLS